MHALNLSCDANQRTRFPPRDHFFVFGVFHHSSPDDVHAERLRHGQTTVERAGGWQPAALRPTQGHAGARLGNARVHYDPADYHGWNLRGAPPQPRPVRAALPSPSSSIAESSDGLPAHAAPMQMRIDSMLCRDSCGLEAATLCPHPRDITSVDLAVAQTCD